MGEGYLRNLWKWSQREVRTLIILQQSETLIQAFSIQMYTFLPNDPFSSEYYNMPEIKYNCFK